VSSQTPLFFRSDDNGKSPDPLVPQLLDACSRHGLKLAFHLEPYKGRTVEEVRADVVYITEQYSTHPAFYRQDGKLPVYYIYDSYHIRSTEWASILSPRGAHTLRGTEYDGIFIGLLVESKHFDDIKDGRFDGFYTYFAANGFTFGSTRSNWQSLASKAEDAKLLFIPSVGPGYVDTRVRPWNGDNERARKQGFTYYERYRHFFLHFDETSPKKAHVWCVLHFFFFFFLL